MLAFGLGVFALVSPATDEARASGTSFLSVMLEDLTIFPAVPMLLMLLAFFYFFLQGPADAD